MTDWKEVLNANGKGVTVRDGNRVDYLVDGFATYRSMYEAIRTTFQKEQGFYIYLLAWWLDDQFPLVPEDNESTIEKLFTKASKEFGVQIRIMVWDNLLAGLPDLLLGAVIASLSARAAVPIQTRQNRQYNALPMGALILDDHLPYLFQSHHQKVLIVKGAQGLIGFCGGLDIAEDRIRHVPLHPNSPFHDVHCRIQGDATNDLVGVFVQRWQAHPASKDIDNQKGKLRGLNDISPVKKRKPTGNQFVGIARTFNAEKNNQWCAQELTVKEIQLAAIRAAKFFIYIEDQYLVSEEVAMELQKALRHIQHLTILTSNTKDTDLPYRDLALAKFVYILWNDRETAYKANVYLRLAGINHSYIHAKTWIIDDELALIGSPNINHHGWYGDSEVLAAIYDLPDLPETRPFAKQLRMHLWAEHLQMEKGKLYDGTKADLWIAAVRAGKILQYFPSDAATREKALQFPRDEPTGFKGFASKKTERDFWNEISDPLPEPLPSCREGGK